MLFSLIFGIDKDIIKIHYHEDINFFFQNLINVALKCGQCISQLKKYHLILEIAIAGPKSRFFFFFFSNLHSIVGIS